MSVDVDAPPRSSRPQPMAILGAVVIMAVLFLGLTGNLGASDEILAAQQEAASATAETSGYPAF